MPSRISRHLRSAHVRPRNTIVARDGSRHYVRGLLAPLARVFYPHFVHAPYRLHNSSVKLGLRVHREVEEWARGTPVRRPHPFTKQIIAALAQLRLEPVEPEVPVLSFGGAFLTRSDLICRHRDADDTVVVSLKTGGSLGYARGAGDCQHLRGVKNCVRNHHQLQLACEVACIEREYGIPVSAAYVIYAGFGKRRATRVDELLPVFKTERVRHRVERALRRDARASGACLPHRVLPPVDE